MADQKQVIGGPLEIGGAAAVTVAGNPGWGSCVSDGSGSDARWGCDV